MFGRFPLSPLSAAVVLGLTLALPAGVHAQASAPAGTAAQPQNAPTKAQKAPAKTENGPTKAQQSQAKAPRKNPPQAPKAEPVIAAASPEQLTAAERVFTGSSQCEFNQSISVEPSTTHTGYVDVRQGKRTWLMKPVLSATGAVRLEDVRQEALMIQIGTKSMLLNQKTGQRLVDDCRHPRQMDMAAPGSSGMLR